MLENIRTLHILLSGALVCFLCIYHIAGTLPHSWKTLRTSGFHEYRNKMLDQESSIFAYRSEYLLPIATLNLKDPRQALLAAIESSPTLQQTGNIADTVSLTDFHHTLLQQYQAIHTSRKLSLVEKKQQMSELKRISHAFYSTILYPKPDQENTAPIYRIGTFMTYFIHKNRSRYLDDSLIVQFDQYFYDENPEVTIKRMRDMGIKYLLVDLNAATIDKDPRRALTTRYEHLLATMRAKNLKLIATDNPCLQFGLNRWHAQKITSLQEYLDLVGTNYESYHEHNGVLTQIPRTHKQNHCASTLITTINSGEQVDTSHPLRTIINGIHASKNQRDIQQTLMPIAQSWFALFEIIDLPMETSVNINPPETPSDTLSSTGISSGTKNRKELTETGNIEK